MCTYLNTTGGLACEMCQTPTPPEFLPAGERPAAYVPPARRAVFDEDDLLNEQMDTPLSQFEAMMHLISSAVDAELVVRGMRHWANLAASTITTAVQRVNPLAAMTTDGTLAGKNELAASLLDWLGSCLSQIFASASGVSRYRGIAPPSREAVNRADMLVKVSDERAGTASSRERSLPIWVACADSKNQVIDVVLSVYARRSRLPEPSEIVFCTAQTRIEDAELLMRRFVSARLHGHADDVYCLADIHTLTYTQQVAVVETLRALLSEYGTANAASLLFVSGKPRQVILNSLSSQQVALPPLDEAELKRVCRQAFERHNFRTEAVTSEINGGGKTHYVHAWVAERQKYEQPELKYRKIAYRESSTVSSLLNVLTKIPLSFPNAFHIDIGHIIPPSANTLLFQLLLVGVLRDTATCRVYHRRTQDLFLVEIPNSVGNKTALALRFCSFLPTTHLKVRTISDRKSVV